MLTEGELQQQAESITDLYAEMQQQIFDRIIYYLKDSIYTKVQKDNILLWQAEQLSKMGMLTNDVIKLLSETTGMAELRIKNLVITNGLMVDSEIRSQLNILTDKKPVSSDSRQILDGLLSQTFDDMNNVVNESLVSRNVQENGALRAYRDIVNRTSIEVVTGLKTKNRAVFDNINKWVNAGLKTNLVDKAGHNWSLEGYTRTVLTTTAHRTFNETRLKAMDDYDVTLAAMSSHAASRPACAPIQGKVVNLVPSTDPRYKPKYDSIYNHGYGEPAGTQGINCHHSLYPFVEGVNKNPFKHPNTEDAIEKGKIKQKQRALERKIRQDKKSLHHAEEIGDINGMTHYKNLLSSHRAKIRGLIKQHDFLNRDYSRERIYYKVKPLNNKQKGALIRYISPDSYIFNASLRDGRITKEQGEWAKQLNSAIDRMPKYKTDKPLYRSYQFTQEQLSKYMGTKDVGDIISDKGYFSTSKKVYDENDNFRIIINKSHSGADLKGYNDAESEVLFKKGTPFKITDAYMQEGRPILEVEELERRRKKL